MPEKVHLRGLDNLTTKDITAFANEYSTHKFEKVEWIDDTSANLIYSSADIALSALESFVDVAHAPPNPQPTDMLPAKSFPGFPDTRLMVRLAVVGDRKQRGARERSRFYLLNPEHDRREHIARDDRGARGGSRGGYRDRDREYKRGYNERGSGRIQRDDPALDESLYDDDEATLRKRASVERDSTPPSYTERSRPRGRGGRRDRELFPEKEGRNSGRLRDRSASPIRGDGDSTMDDLAADDRAKRNRTDAGRNRMSAQIIKDRLSNSTAPHLELFPERATGTRRKSAFEGDEAADLFAEKMRLPSMDGGAGGLESRISRPGQTREFKIRGQAAAAAQPNPGMTIKGLASSGAKSKELFPTKVAMNTGKELFSDRIGGGRRKKADDLFQ